jgi:Interferon-induced transmembrane protein/zinc-ribbon domain
MFCPQCGTSNADTAAICVRCGRPLQPVAPIVVQPGLQPAVNVPNYLVFAILVTVLCCLPAGIPAIVYAAQVNGKLQAGDIAGAQQASNNAKMWCWISAGLALAFMVAYMLLVLAGVMHHRSY